MACALSAAVRARAGSGQARPPLRPGSRENRRLHTVLLLVPPSLQRRALHHAFRGAGVDRVLEAETAAEALQWLSAELVDLVVTAWQVPDGSGRALVQKLHNRGRNRDVPVVVLDPGLPRSQVVSAVKAGVVARLPLPADGKAVRTLLERLAAERSEATGAEPTPSRPLPS